MKNVFNSFLVLICIGLAANLIISCDKDCPEPTGGEQACTGDNECSRGFTCINNTCGCPEDGFVFNGHCIPNTQSEWPNFRGFTGSCFCYDTISFSILGTGESRTISMLFKEGDLIGSGTTGAEYFAKPDGDSLHVFQMPVKCARAIGNKLIPEAFGKIRPNGNMDIRLVFRDGVTLEYVDECVTTLKRIN